MSINYRRSRVPGQSSVLIAIMLPFLAALLMTGLEIGERYLERVMVEDAVRQAARSAAQSFEYAAFAEDTHRLTNEGRVNSTGCVSAPAGSARAIGCRVLLSNLAGVRGLQETPAQTAERVRWSILPDGGTCTFPNGQPSAGAATPLVCASVQPRMTGLLGWGIWTPQIDAAETLDREI